MFSGSSYPAQTIYEDSFDSSGGGTLKLLHSFYEVGVNGDYVGAYFNEFHPTRIFFDVDTHHAITYKYTDNSLFPPNSTKIPVFTLEIVDSINSNNVGFGIAKMADGSVITARFSNGKQEVVTVPNEYKHYLWNKYQRILSATSQANTRLQPAKQIEREYLFKACNGKSGVKGLDNATFTKICTWRDQFKEPYATASANYQKQLEELRAQAATAEQQRQIQQQLAQQQQRQQQQQYEYQMASLAQSLNGVAQSISNSVPPTYQFVPIVQPSLSYGSSPTTYRKVGSTVLGSDGTACQVAGSTVICR